MKSVRRYIIPLLISVIMLSTSARAFKVTRHEQENTNWCWAASAQMMGEAVGRYVTQSAIVDYVKGTVANVPAADIFDEGRAVDYATLRYSTIHRTPLTFAAAMSELGAEEPIFVRIEWRPRNGHAVVASGYNLSVGTITIVDPAEGCGIKAFPYRTMVSGCTFQSGTGKWTDSITI